MVRHQAAVQDTSFNEAGDHFYDGRFHNEDAVPPNTLAAFFGVMKRYITERKVDAFPSEPLPINTLNQAQLLQLPDDALFVIRLGHSSILLKVYGEFWLIDPVFSERASPFSFLGPKRFHRSPIDLAELPPIDKVLISHNHYDHLDKTTIRWLSSRVKEFLVPLGVEQDFVRWGVSRQQIQSFDWWQELPIKQGLIAFTPARHFSGRGLSDGNRSLWGGWVIKTPHESLYFSGDSGYFSGFSEIGRKYGPFDLTMIETGAYDRDWPAIHMTPEQSVQAHIDLKGQLMMPVHNGTFDLAFHAWYDPLERVAQAADQRGVTLLTPIPGTPFNVRQPVASEPWWQALMPQKPAQP
ncbi:MBL fold metallo-hydrolase [Salinispirillum marinum]|uniref:MBL fold metallo-hydrolase n=2 Tax=Saccharospirillaceae TaxID=255527 RepID=A0ABV8BEI6_9GAMM